MPPEVHLTDESLLELVLDEVGLLSDTSAEAIRPRAESVRHLVTCPACADRAAQWRALAWSAALASPEPEPALVAEVWSEARARVGLPADSRSGSPGGQIARNLASAMRRLAAALRTDPLQPAVAVRGSAAAAPRLLIFETEELAVSLSISAQTARDGARIIGGIAPRTANTLPPGGQVTLYAADRVIEADISSHGEFTLDHVPGGDLHMEIALGRDVIEISPISVGKSACAPGEE